MLRIMDNECVQIIPPATFWGKFSEVDNWQFCGGDSWVYFFCQDPMNYLQFWWRLGEGEEVSRYFVAAVSLVSWKIESVPISARIRPHGPTLSPPISHTGDSAGITKCLKNRWPPANEWQPSYKKVNFPTKSSPKLLTLVFLHISATVAMEAASPVISFISVVNLPVNRGGSRLAVTRPHLAMAVRVKLGSSGV